MTEHKVIGQNWNPCLLLTSVLLLLPHTTHPASRASCRTHPAQSGAQCSASGLPPLPTVGHCKHAGTWLCHVCDAREQLHGTSAACTAQCTWPHGQVAAHLLDAARRANHNAGRLLLQQLLLLSNGHASKEVGHLDTTEPRTEALELVADLRRAMRGGTGVTEPGAAMETMVLVLRGPP